MSIPPEQQTYLDIFIKTLDMLSINYTKTDYKDLIFIHIGNTMFVFTKTGMFEGVI